MSDAPPPAGASPAGAAPPAAPELVAREKFQCPSCGAEAEWNPAKQKLVCPFCGTEAPAPAAAGQDAGAIVEHDLVAALRAIPDTARGWQAPKISVRCQSCQAISVFDAGTVGERCAFCGSTALVPYEQVKDAFRPESLLALRIPESQARDTIRAWYGRQWLAPNRFRSRALTDTVKGVYLPYWTFDAKADATWTAESGHHYWVQVGNQRVMRTDWRPASGAVSHVFDDELVCASLGVDAGRLRQIEPFPTVDSLVPYDPKYLSGWTVEHYQIDLVAAAARARAGMNDELRQLCVRQIPGDTYRNLSVHADFHDQTFKHILAPVWLLTYSYGARSFQVVVNGVTGRIAGSRPWSAIKVAGVVLLAVAVLICFLYLQNR